MGDGAFVFLLREIRLPAGDGVAARCLRLAGDKLFQLAGLRRIGGDNPGAFLHVVEGGDAIIVMQDQVRAEGCEIRHPGMRFEASPEIIGNVAGKSALERRQARHMGLRVLRHKLVNEAQGGVFLLHAIEECASPCDL